MTLFTISRKKKSRPSPPDHACSSFRSFLPSLILFNSEFHKHRKSQKYILGFISSASNSKPVPSLCCVRSSHTRTHTHTSAHEFPRTLKHMGTQAPGTDAGHSHRTAFQKHHAAQSTLEPGFSAVYRSVDLIKMRGLAHTTHSVCRFPAETHSKCKKDRLSPGLYNYGPVISLLLFGFQVTRKCTERVE